MHFRKVCLLLIAGFANQGKTQDLQLPAVEVFGSQDASIGTADSASEGTADRASLQARPKLRPGDIVEAVPGVVATQHSSDGKANQYFLRGFNLDHGTDFAMTVDGMPVNMPSHGHGQGFSDLNFLIPELVSGVRYRKGPYFPDGGDFSLAGSASIDYVSSLEDPFAEVTLGAHNYRHILVAGSRTVQDQTWLGALEAGSNNGPWDRPEDLRKVNALVRFSSGSPTRGLTISGMAYQSRWNSTDQIPQRLINSGVISRFGTLDPSNGGNTQRLSLSGKWFDNGPNTKTQLSAYVIDYRFNLFSNFTYALNNSINGDQFQQTDQRHVFGAQASHNVVNQLLGWDGLASFGAQWRGDRIGEVGLFKTEARERLSTVRNDVVSQDLFSVYGQQLLNFSERWRAYLGVRGDTLQYDVQGREMIFGAANSGAGQSSLVSPKAGLALTLTPSAEVYLNGGVGMHSNDVRGATITLDPQTGLPADKVPALVKGTGFEVGWRFKPNENLSVTTAIWKLNLDSELVYVGDAGTTQPGRASTRHGVETTLRWRLNPRWRFELDGAFSRASFTGDSPAGEGNHVANAAEQVLASGVTYTEGPWTSSLRGRYMGPRALDTLNSVRSSATTVLNLGVRYAVNKQLSLGVDIFNLTGKNANDIEYFYASCTTAEARSGRCGSGIADRHVHPMESRTVRLSARMGF